MDAKALALADKDISRGFGLSQSERVFLYLPFEHSEAPAMQARSVTLFRALGDPEQTQDAEAHKAIIDRFGRFPHRNAILGRPSSRGRFSQRARERLLTLPPPRRHEVEQSPSSASSGVRQAGIRLTSAPGRFDQPAIRHA
jgi:hypothetical protein